MASIGSLSSATSSLVSGGGGLHGYGGLASGLDRDTLIESMTYGTRAKIAKQQQKKQTFEWKQDAYRSVTDKLVALSTKYMDYTNPATNLTNSSFFAKTNIVSNGVNASKVKVTSNGGTADSMTILGVKQMAQNAAATSANRVSDSALTTGYINSDQMVDSFKNQTLDIKYGDKTYTVQFGDISGTDTQKIEKLNEALKKVSVDGGKTLADLVQFEENTAGSGVKLTSSEEDVSLVGGSAAILKAMGQSGADLKDNPIQIKDGDLKADWKTPMSFEERIVGQSLTFSYNGNSTTIQITQKALDATGESDTRDAVAQVLQDGLNKAFGKGRIKVEAKDTQDDNGNSSKKLSFQTMLPNSDTVDNSSILTLSYGSTGMTGNDGAFNVLAGENNRLNLNATLEQSGLNGIAELVKGLAPNKELELEINDKKITGITRDSTINDIIKKINDSDAGVEISYSASSDKFTITSKDQGASGKVNINTADNSLAALLFGQTKKSDGTYGIDVKGQDAIVTVQYAGSSEQVNLIRSSNTFTQDGLNITIKGTFGEYKETTNPYDAEIDIEANAKAGNEVTFESTANTDSIISAIKDMVTAYNEVVDLVNSLVSTKPNRDYAPLTDDQKEEMTDDQIEKWEKKAKEGILFGDDLLRGLSSDLRFVAGGSLINELEKIGITEASGYSSNGKLTIDETKLKNALETDPDNVANLFTKKDGGLMTNLKDVTDRYAKTWGTKGSLIARAGSEAAATSLTDNEIYTSMKDIDDIITQLQSRLKSEQDRYLSQFTTLETLIAQMNSQSSYLSSMTSGY